MKLLYLYGTSSAVNGHDPRTLPLEHGDRVFAWDHDTLYQNPGDGDGLPGCSPMRAFADELAGLRPDDEVAICAIDTVQVPGMTGNWKDGLKQWNGKSAEATLAKIQPLLDQGWELAGIVMACDGEYQTQQRANMFCARAHQMLEKWRSVMGDPDLHNFLVQTVYLAPNHLAPDRARSIMAYRHAQRDIEDHDSNTTFVHTQNWGQLDHSPLHMDVNGLHTLGEHVAYAANDFLLNL